VPVTPEPIRKFAGFDKVARTLAVQDRTGGPTKFLESTEIKLSESVADLMLAPSPAMLVAFIYGERDLQNWPGWPRGSCASASRNSPRH
jgi:hypothetical protein